MFISKSASISQSTKLVGDCKIGDNVVINGECYLEDCEIDEGTTIWSSVIKKAKIGKNSSVGPFAHIRPGCDIGDNTRVGNFVELKNATVGSGSKIAHLTYVGDAVIGKNCNLGCGVVFCNYDGKEKHKSIIGDNVFIGSNVNIVAPIKIEDNCFLAAGSTVTESVSSSTFVIARSRQTNKPRKEK